MHCEQEALHSHSTRASRRWLCMEGSRVFATFKDVCTAYRQVQQWRCALRLVVVHRMAVLRGVACRKSKNSQDEDFYSHIIICYTHVMYSVIRMSRTLESYLVYACHVLWNPIARMQRLIVLRRSTVATRLPTHLSVCLSVCPFYDNATNQVRWSGLLSGTGIQFGTLVSIVFLIENLPTRGRVLTRSKGNEGRINMLVSSLPRKWPLVLPFAVNMLVSSLPGKWPLVLPFAVAIVLEVCTLSLCE